MNPGIKPSLYPYFKVLDIQGNFLLSISTPRIIPCHQYTQACIHKTHELQSDDNGEEKKNPLAVTTHGLNLATLCSKTVWFSPLFPVLYRIRRRVTALLAWTLSWRWVVRSPSFQVESRLKEAEARKYLISELWQNIQRNLLANNKSWVNYINVFWRNSTLVFILCVCSCACFLAYHPNNFFNCHTKSNQICLWSSSLKEMNALQV